MSRAVSSGGSLSAHTPNLVLATGCPGATALGFGLRPRPIDQTSSQPLRSPQPRHSVPVAALSPVDGTSSHPLCTTEQQHSVAVQETDSRVPIRTTWGKKLEPNAEPSGKVHFVLVPVPVDLAAPQCGQPTSKPLCAPEPEPSVPVPALAPVDSAAPHSGQPSSQPMCAPKPQPYVRIQDFAPVVSAASHGCQPSSQPLRAHDPHQYVPVPILAPVDSAAPQGGQPSSQPLRAPKPQPYVRIQALGAGSLGCFTWLSTLVTTTACP